eukprot:TRINITY_DN6528_c0_g2_i1.p1 TRINITY_DN6528_c0_g2~~TRINITY_DN6528_c0_g2_i1.p1  ORF type:complete len:128 (-),score=2.76 TRINITY_DN6528_c0_g2_i1:1019-1402(-)
MAGGSAGKRNQMRRKKRGGEWTLPPTALMCINLKKKAFFFFFFVSSPHYSFFSSEEALQLYLPARVGGESHGRYFLFVRDPLCTFFFQISGKEFGRGGCLFAQWGITHHLRPLFLPSDIFFFLSFFK